MPGRSKISAHNTNAAPENAASIEGAAATATAGDDRRLSVQDIARAAAAGAGAKASQYDARRTDGAGDSGTQKDDSSWPQSEKQPRLRITTAQLPANLAAPPLICKATAPVIKFKKVLFPDPPQVNRSAAPAGLVFDPSAMPAPQADRLKPSHIEPPPGRPRKPPLITTRFLLPTAKFPAPTARQAHAPASHSPRWWLRHIARFIVLAAATYAAICLVLLAVYRFIDPPTSNLMLWRRLQGVDVQSRWVPLKTISPNLIRAVIASEDGRFCQHNGVDFGALREAVRGARAGHLRGASTISMQVTKNLLLWNSKSYIRKALEIPLTMLMELMWPKTRILEVYLNIAEWGDGIFGIEAAARYHFDRSARKLTLRQASLLAVSLPNPHHRMAGNPDRRTSAMARRIARRVQQSRSQASCILSKHGRR